ncbi:MAG: YIP1 family protein [Deltaproteobacteria bacterium]|nr:YIP1 family protein [Deltaproteobacteria bacterium]
MFPQMISRITKMIAKPREYWDEMMAEPGDLKTLLVPQILILAAIPAVSLMLGTLLGGLRFMRFGIYGRLAGGAIATGLITYLLNIVLWWAFALIIDALAPSFGAQKNVDQARKLATGAIIPSWVGMALHLTSIPALGALGALAGMGFGCYLLYLGLPMMNGTPPEKAAGYTAAAAGCLLVAGLIVGAVACIPASCCVATSVIL